MRKLAAWIAVTLGLAALLRKLRGRRLEEAAPETEVDPADELRRTIAETREDEMPVPGVPPGPEPEIDEPSEDELDDASVDERRAAVYEQGRAAIDEMQLSNDEPGR